MLAAPVVALFVGRSLLPDLGGLERLFSGPATAAPAPPDARERGHALRVKVLDGNGDPVPGAAVRVVSPRPPFRLLHEAACDAQGGAALPQASTETVRVVASHEPEGVVTSAELTLRPDEGREVELVLTAAEAVRGTVADTNDYPVAGAALSIDGMPWAVSGAASDADGAFRLATVPHEATALVVAARGFRTATISLTTPGASPAERVVRVRLATAPAVEGDVSDLDGHPVRARVIACEGEPSESIATSGPDGRFSLPPRAIGCGVVALSETSAASDTVVAVEGQRLTLRLKPGGSIEGVVVDERGAAVRPFMIGIESFSASRGKSVRSGGQRSVDDPRGAFRLERLAPGTYVLTASGQGKPPTRSDPVAVSGGAATTGVRIVLSAGGVVTGHVYDPQHAAIAGATLSFDQVSSAVQSTARAESDARGAFRLEGAPAGPFTVRAEKEGFRMRMVAGLRVESGGSLTQDITLNPSSSGGGLELGGIGATIDRTREGIVLRSVFPGDPADRAGLRAGDLVTRIDGETTEGMSMADALQRLRGEAGTIVGLSVQRARSEEPRGPREAIDAVVVRAVVVH